MKQKCKSLFCALFEALGADVRYRVPGMGGHYGAGVWHRCVSA